MLNVIMKNDEKRNDLLTVIFLPEQAEPLHNIII